jgi:bifunctional non-homologous end joining protein LigD
LISRSFRGIYKSVTVLSPAFIAPCVPRLVSRPPIGGDWLHEAKLDGWCVQIVKDGLRVALYSRNGIDLAERFPDMAEACCAILARSCIIDGELVAADCDFWSLPRAAGRNGAGVCVVAFDLLHHNGRDVRGLPLIKRKDLLQDLLIKSGVISLVYSDHYPDGSSLLRSAEKLGLEGVVSKRRDAPYRSGRCSTWLKIKSPAWIEANRERWQAFVKVR